MVMVRDRNRDRLSIYVDGKIKKDAHQEKINISEICEITLKAQTIARKNTLDAYLAYSQFLKSIVPILEEYDFCIQIADDQEVAPTIDHEGNEVDGLKPLDIFLLPNGSFLAEDNNYPFKNIKKISLSAFRKPDEILKNLVDVLTKKVKARKEKVRELLMAKNIVYAISKSLLDEVTVEKQLTASKTKSESKKYRRKLSK